MFFGANPFAFICLLAVGFVIEDISSAFHYSRTVGITIAWNCTTPVGSHQKILSVIY